jgi:hypothetical protein
MLRQRRQASIRSASGSGLPGPARWTDGRYCPPCLPNTSWPAASLRLGQTERIDEILIGVSRLIPLRRGKRRKGNTNRSATSPLTARERTSKHMARRTAKNRWFVSVAVEKPGRVKAFVRRTETFPTETDAKQFAKKMLSETHQILAGTLLGAYQPARRILSGWHLRRWIEEEGN